MNPTDYLKIGLITGLFIVGVAIGYRFEHVRFVAFKEKTEAVAKVQEAKIESIAKQQELVNKGIKDEYDAKLIAVRNYYKSTSMWNNSSSSEVSGISIAPKSADVIAAYNVLAGQCAEATLQLVQLQKWLNEQIGIK